MLLELDPSRGRTVRTDTSGPVRASAPRRRRFRAGWLAVAAPIALALAWAFAPFVIVAIDAARRHMVFLGVSSYFPVDGLQYLAWARDAQNGLIRNLFGAASDRAVFIHPVWTPTGAVEALTGVGSSVVMGFWKVLSALVLLAGCLRLVARHLPSRRPGLRGAALTLCLFGGLTPLAGLIAVLGPRIDGWDYFSRASFELIPAVALWDYVPLALALGLFPFAIERFERLLEGGAGRRAVAVTALLAGLVAWLHPWQGESLMAIAGGLVVWRWSDRRSLRGTPWPALVAVLGACAAPIVYYLLLSRVDPGWAVAERYSVADALIPAPVLVSCVAPLFAVSLLAGRRLACDERARSLLLWPASTMLSVAISPSGQLRAVDGLAIPVAVLAFKAWGGPRSSPRRSLAIAMAVIAVLAPCAVFAADAFRRLRSSQDTQYTEYAPSDVRAVQLAARLAPGQMIVAPMSLGAAIPALADAPAWVGHPVWTVDIGGRRWLSRDLFDGSLTPPKVRALVRATGSRALVEPCGFSGRLGAALAPLGFRERRLGCARLYLRPGRGSTQG